MHVIYHGQDAGSDLPEIGMSGCGVARCVLTVSKSNYAGCPDRAAYTRPALLSSKVVGEIAFPSGP